MVDAMSFRGEQNIKGTTYVFEAVSYWDAEKAQSRQKRIYIGKKDPVSGTFIPNRKYYELYGNQAPLLKNAALHAEKPFAVMKSLDYGNIYLMSRVADKTGLISVLQNCFPHQWEEILSCAMHVCSENEALYLCEQWALNSYVPSAPSSQRISNLLKELDEDSRMHFYKQWAALRAETEYLALDISSVSSWSELIHFVEWGYNRDRENLPQINLAMLFGEQSRLPVFSRVYPGSIKDVSTLVGVVTFIEQLQLKKMHFVMDKGFYSAKGISLLLEKYIKFAVSIPFSTNLAKEAVQECMGSIEKPSNAIEVGGRIYYALTLMRTMNRRRVYIHVFYDHERHMQETNRLLRKIMKIEADVASGKTAMDNREARKYLSFQKTKDGSYNIHRREDVINEKVKLAGYVAILSNDRKDAADILSVYHAKDVVEKSFNNIKNDLDLERLRIHSDTAMEGRIFIGFISLIIISYIREIMRKNDLYKHYSFHELFAELKKLRLVEFASGQKLLTELSSNQKDLFEIFDVRLPDSSSL